MVDNAADCGQEAYGQFYLPLTNMPRSRGIDAINPRQHGLSGRWRMFHTGYEGIVYVLALEQDIRRNVCVWTRKIANDGGKTLITQAS